MIQWEEDHQNVNLAHIEGGGGGVQRGSNFYHDINKQPLM